MTLKGPELQKCMKFFERNSYSFCNIRQDLGDPSGPSKAQIELIIIHRIQEREEELSSLKNGLRNQREKWKDMSGVWVRFDDHPMSKSVLRRIENILEGLAFALFCLWLILKQINDPKMSPKIFSIKVNLDIP